MKKSILLLLGLISLNSHALTTEQFIESIASKSGLSKADAKRALEGFTSEAAILYNQGDIVPVPGSGAICKAKEKGNKTKCSNTLRTGFTPNTPTLHAAFRIYFSNGYHAALTKAASDIRTEVQKAKNNGIKEEEEGFGGDLSGENVAFNPLATGVPHLYISHFSAALGQFLLKEDPNQLLSDEKTARNFIDKWMGEWGFASETFEYRREIGPEGNAISQKTTDVTGEIFLTDGREMAFSGNQVDEILVSGQDPIIRNIRKRLRMDQDSVEAFFKAFSRTLQLSLSAGDVVEAGGLGTFSVSRQATGNVVRFKAGSELSEKVN